MNRDAIVKGLVKPLTWFDRPDGQDARIGRYDQIAYGVSSLRRQWGYRRHGEVGLTVSYKGGPLFTDEQDAMKGAEADYRDRIAAALDVDKIVALVRAVEVPLQALRAFQSGATVEGTASDWADEAERALAAFRGDAISGEVG